MVTVRRGRPEGCAVRGSRHAEATLPPSSPGSSRVVRSATSPGVIGVFGHGPGPVAAVGSSRGVHAVRCGRCRRGPLLPGLRAPLRPPPATSAGSSPCSSPTSSASPTLSETVDPEQVKNLVDSCFERLVADITAFGGRVDKIVGDAHRRPVRRAGRPRGRRRAGRPGRPADAGDAGRHPGRSAPSGRATRASRCGSGSTPARCSSGALRAGGATRPWATWSTPPAASRPRPAPARSSSGPPPTPPPAHCIAYEHRGLLAAQGREARSRPGRPRAPAPAGPPPRRRDDVPLVGRDARAGPASTHRWAPRSGTSGPSLASSSATRAWARPASRELADAHGRARARLVLLEGRCVPYGEANVWWPVAEALRRCGVDSAADPDEVRAARVGRVGGRPGRRGRPTTTSSRVTDGLLT